MRGKCLIGIGSAAAAILLGAAIIAPSGASASAECEALNSGSKFYISSSFPVDAMLLSMVNFVYSGTYLPLGKTVNGDGVYTWSAYHGDLPSRYASIHLQKTDRNYWRFSMELSGEICTGFLRAGY
jgi:hypothetical protein